MSLVIDSCTTTGTADYELYGPLIPDRCQSITGDGRSLGGVSFIIKKQGSPTGNVYAKLWTLCWGEHGISATPEGCDLLATSDPIDATTIPDTETWVTFNFASPHTLEDGTHYIVGIEFTGGDADNHVRVDQVYGGSAHDGNFSELWDGDWDYYTDWDMNFIAYASYASPLPTFRPGG